MCGLSHTHTWYAAERAREDVGFADWLASSFSRRRGQETASEGHHQLSYQLLAASFDGLGGRGVLSACLCGLLCGLTLGGTSCHNVFSLVALPVTPPPARLTSFWSVSVVFRSRRGLSRHALVGKSHALKCAHFPGCEEIASDFFAVLHGCFFVSAFWRFLPLRELAHLRCTQARVFLYCFPLANCLFSCREGLCFFNPLPAGTDAVYTAR